MPIKKWLQIAITALLCAAAIPGAFYLLRALAMKPELVDGRYRSFKKFYRRIEIGMNREEVFRIQGICYPANGSRQAPQMAAGLHDVWFTLNPEGQREPNCEMFGVRFDQGKVASKSYSRD